MLAGLLALLLGDDVVEHFRLLVKVALYVTVLRLCDRHDRVQLRLENHLLFFLERDFGLQVQNLILDLL